MRKSRFSGFMDPTKAGPAQVAWPPLRISCRAAYGI
jgi:hypothetical protein